MTSMTLTPAPISERPTRPVLRLVNTGLPPHTPPRSRLRTDPVLLPRRPGPEATGTEQAAEVRLVGAMATIVLEVLQGRRPLRQLAQCLDPDAVAVVQSLGRTTTWTGSRLASARASRVGRASVEGCARIDLDGRSVMLLLRLEAGGQRWRCVRLELLCTDAHLTHLGLSAA